MSKTLTWIIVALSIIIGYIVYDRWSRSRLQVTPEVRQEIEKAKER
ncbi:MAG: hypothetical protein ABI972_10710 [Acidobacteriota bacterium]